MTDTPNINQCKDCAHVRGMNFPMITLIGPVLRVPVDREGWRCGAHMDNSPVVSYTRQCAAVRAEYGNDQDCPKFIEKPEDTKPHTQPPKGIFSRFFWSLV